MGRYKAFLALILAISVGSFAFQNCSGVEANLNDGTAPVLTPTASTTSDETNPDPKVVPAYFVNKDLDLDNPGFSSALGYSTGSTSPDAFYYETDYLATYESSQVTIKGEGNAYLFKFQSDACTASKEFTAQDQIDFAELFQLAFNNATINVPQAGDTTDVGCSFPRLTLSMGDVAQEDVDIFLSSKACTPANAVYVTNVGGDDPALVISNIDTFFKDHINSICP